MKEWLRLKWRTKGWYIALAFAMIAAWVMTPTLDGQQMTPAEVGIFLGTLMTIVVWMGPIVFVDIKNIKVRHPKEKFVEPSQFKILLFYLAGMIVAVFVAMVIGILIYMSKINVLINNEGVVGSMIMMFLLLSIIFSPLTVYMLNAKLRYKRIVEYKTAEWKKLQK